MLIEDLYRAPWHERMNGVIKNMVDSVIKDEAILAIEVLEWQKSERRKNMIVGEQYYLNKTAIVEKTQELEWKSNRQLEHGYAKKLVDQKIGYLLSNEPTLATDDDTYGDIIKDIFSRGLLKKIKNVGKEAINKGIAYLYPYINEDGEMAFKKFPSEQIIPFWEDNEHLKIVSFARVYEVSVYEGTVKKKVTKVEYYHAQGINYYIMEQGKLIADVPAGIEKERYFTIGDKSYTWERIPLIHFKYNEEEQPLIDSIKTLVDNYNMQTSTNADLLLDIPNFVYKLINYGGEDMAEFTQQLRENRVVAVEEGGDVGKLQADIQTVALENEVKRIRDSIYEFGRGVDASGDDMGNASGVALRTRYSDLDMDCNILESEFQSSIKQMLWFINHYLGIIGKGDYTETELNFIFNRDIIISETETITNCSASVGILDDQTIRENHPWYNDEVEERLEKQEAELKKEMEGYQGTFPPKGEVKANG